MREVKTQSKTRRAGADATRSRVLEAAERLFLRNGYAATSIREIADEAQVAVQTVYWVFGTKAALVAGIRDRWLARAETGERLRAVFGIDAPRERLAASAAFMRHQWETGQEAVAIQQDAMRADPEIRASVDEVLANRSRQLAKIIAPLGDSLRRDIQPDEAVDIFIALLGFDLYRELRGRGWTAARYERWLARTLHEALLDDPHGPKRDAPEAWSGPAWTDVPGADSS
jgi:AcrR family transcriptional regulator